MCYRQAKKLHSGDEIRTKIYGNVLTVVSVEIHRKDVIILAEDGNKYHHTEVK